LLRACVVTPTQPHGGNDNNAAVIAGIVVGVCIALLIVVIVVIVLLRKRKYKLNPTHPDNSLNNSSYLKAAAVVCFSATAS